MIGPPKLRCLDQPIGRSIEELVPQDHFYRFLDAKLDLTFVRTWVADRYAERGRPSIDPVVFFRLQLLMFFEGIRSERKLMEMVALNLAHRWYLGYNLDEPLPDHSSLTRIRTRLGLPILQRFFEHMVELCQEAGLVWGKELFFDGTKVRANADIDSLTPRFYQQAKQHLAELFAAAAVTGEGAADQASPPEDDPLASPATHWYLRLLPRALACPQPCPCRFPVPAHRRPRRSSRSRTRRLGNCWTNTGSTRAGPRRVPIVASPTSA